jgi:hypothetical protein
LTRPRVAPSPGRGARSLPEGRRRAPRERSACPGSGERSRPHPTSLAVRSLPRREPPPSLRSGDYSRRELLADGGPSSSVSAFDRGTENLPRRLAYARGARSLPEGRRRAPRERSAERGTRLAVEALWPSREPVRRRRRSIAQRVATWRPHPTSLAVRSLPRREPPPSLRSGDYSRRELLGDGWPTSLQRSIAAPGVVRGVRAYARGARSLPEGRRRAPRERRACAGSGERSRPHPTSLAVRSLPRREPPPSLRSGDYSRRELLDDRGPTRPVSAFDRGHQGLSEASGLTLAAREVSQRGGGARRGSEALAPDQASGRGRIPRRSQSARSRGVSLLPRFARETTHAASYWKMVD